MGGGSGKENPPPRELARRLSTCIWGNWRCWRLSLLKDCRLYAPHSQIWPEYKMETASCYLCYSVVTRQSILFAYDVSFSLQHVSYLVKFIKIFVKNCILNSNGCISL